MDSRLTLGPDGVLHLAGVFRYNGDSLAGETGYQTNHRCVYMRSPDGGTTWQRSDGSAIAVPVVEDSWFQDLGEAQCSRACEGSSRGSQHHERVRHLADKRATALLADGTQRAGDE